MYIIILNIIYVTLRSINININKYLENIFIYNFEN